MHPGLINRIKVHVFTHFFYFSMPNTTLVCTYRYIPSMDRACQMSMQNSPELETILDCAYAQVNSSSGKLLFILSAVQSHPGVKYKSESGVMDCPV